MFNQSIDDNDFNGAETLDGECISPVRLALPNPAPAGRHQTTDLKLGIKKWEKRNKQGWIDYWVRSGQQQKS